jgi:hypothetical protein
MDGCIKCKEQNVPDQNIPDQIMIQYLNGFYINLYRFLWLPMTQKNMYGVVISTCLLNYEI